ncbi:TolC family protein [Paracraurococcus lichenis]|uniref:TolC family protein n=1 Tax=Paracraurococcus lichenis TaxID=3064888 RepID=A0ABT9E6R8_9PROT|nr:TolC family protein [Paracraurococcus sp. LOR1-02]MDO9711849.1 TolC family protein [Paracraurococcus sp. LOR1-02]
MPRLFLAAACAAALLAAGQRDAAAQQTPLSRPPLAVPPEVNPPAPVLRPPTPAPRRAPPPREEPPPPPRARRAPPPPSGPPPMESAALARDLDAALSIDAVARAIQGQREAVRSRDAQVRSPIAGSPAIGSSFRSDTRGPRLANEWDVELGAPLWLPGQRSALAGTVNAGVEEQERRLALRRLELAGLLRDAYWAVGAAESELRVARDRLATARDIGRDVQRRVELGDIAETEALLTRNETLAAELDLARAEAAVQAARAAYRTLTGGSEAALLPPGTSAGMAGARPEPALGEATPHPAIRAAEAALATAEARARLVRATPIDNPELGLFTRGQGGPATENGTSLGLRVRIPLPTEARNAPRRADAEAERTRAEGELIQARRVIEGEIGLARLGLAAAGRNRQLAAQRRAVAEQQLTAARTAFRSGEIGAFDLFRVRQLQIEAAAVEARAEVEAGRARSRLNQALGLAPRG